MMSLCGFRIKHGFAAKHKKHQGRTGLDVADLFVRLVIGVWHDVCGSGLAIAGVGARPDFVKKKILQYVMIDWNATRLELRARRARDDERERVLTDALVEIIKSNDLLTLKAFSDSDMRFCCKFTSYGAFSLGYRMFNMYIDRWPLRTGQSPLHVASLLGRVEVLRVMLSAGVDLEVFCPRGQTPLMLAITHGHFEVVDMLERAGALLLNHGENGRTSLHWAAFYNHLDIARLYCESYRSLVSCRDGHELSGETALDVILNRSEGDLLWHLRRSAMVIYLLRALALCGGPVPRLPRVIPHIDSSVEVMTADDGEFIAGGGAFRRVRMWREAASLQRHLHVRQYLPTRSDYDPSLLSSIPLVENIGKRKVTTDQGERYLTASQGRSGS